MFMPTPEEIAGSSNGPEVQAYLLNPSRTPREILRFIKAAPKEAHDTHLATHALKVRISEEQSESAEKMERQTRQLVFLTWALLVVIFVLLVYTVRGR